MWESHLEVQSLELAYGGFVVMRDLNFQIKTGSISFIAGKSGCGKSTLLKHLIGLYVPKKGDVFYGEQSFFSAKEEQRQRLQRSFGVLFQGGALLGDMTLEENVALPLEMYTDLNHKQISEIALFKLSLVGLKGIRAIIPFSN